MSNENSAGVEIALNYYFLDKEINIITSCGTDAIAQQPLYAHESCKVKITCTGSIREYRRSMRWDFGDGTIINGRNAVHYYKNPGKYTISCTLFDSKLKPIQNTSTITVFVKEVIPTIISVEREYNMSPTLCRATRLAEIGVTLSNSVISEPSISARRTFARTDDKESSYFDIKDTYQYHLYPYYTFLQEITAYDFNNDTQWDKTLKPVNEYAIKYHPVYGEFTSDCQWNFYSLSSTDHNKSVIKIFNPKSSTVVDYRGQLNNDLYISKEISFKTNISEIPSSASICGKIATFNVWYKTDKDTNEINDLFFFFNENELKMENDLQSDTNYINMPPLGISIYPVKARFDELHPFLSFNGFANNADSENKHIETYLKNSFYKGHTVPAIGAYFIKNDSVIAETSYSLYKLVPSEGALELKINNKSFLGENNNYYSLYDIPVELKNGKFILEFNTSSKNIKIYETDNLIDLESIKLPAERLYEEDTNKLINCYTPHTLFDEADKFKTLLSTILSNNNMLNYIISKGLNFIDDNINYKTCYIDRLLAILESMGEHVVQYNSDLFKNINELRDITRILSMSYSNLFGNTFNDIYDLRISSTDNGKNIADRLLPGDIFYFGNSDNENPAIVAFKRGGVIYPLLKPIKNFVIVEDYSGNLKTGSFETIRSNIFIDFSDQTPEWIEKNAELINSIYGAFSLSEYEASWLWNLVLPKDYNTYNDKENLIHRYYSFYLFNDNDETEVRKFNFLDEKTIPLQNGKQMTYTDWNDINGFTYHCLVKVINDKINIK